MAVWQCRDRQLALDQPVLMGIVNVTPDSFFEGSRCSSLSGALVRARALYQEGAKILDIGGESTRPGAEDVSDQDEIVRTCPVIRALKAEMPEAFISIDTRHTAVARAAIEAGVDIVNDVSGVDPQPGMWQLIAESGVGYVLMHARGNPRTMDGLSAYGQDVVDAVADQLQEARLALIDLGCVAEQIVLDPGLGFAKDHEGNLALLAQTNRLTQIAPVLVGASRKRFIGALTDQADAANRAAGSMGAALWAADQGAQIIRVHDVRATADALAVFLAAKGALRD